MVSFNVMSLLTRGLIQEAMSNLGPQHEDDIMRFFHHIPASSYFRFCSQYYKQTDSMAMGPPLSLVTANFFTEGSEEVALERAIHKSLCWFHYIDDTPVMWPPWSQRLRDFLNQMNSVHQNIQFTMEVKRDNHLPGHKYLQKT
jgi:hypothetical protein